MRRSCCSRLDVYNKLIRELEKSGIGRDELTAMRFDPYDGINWLGLSVTIGDFDTIIKLVGMVRQRTAAKCQRQLEERIRLELTERVVAALSVPAALDISEQ